MRTRKKNKKTVEVARIAEEETARIKAQDEARAADVARKVEGETARIKAEDEGAAEVARKAEEETACKEAKEATAAAAAAEKARLNAEEEKRVVEATHSASLEQMKTLMGEHAELKEKFAMREKAEADLKTNLEDAEAEVQQMKGDEAGLQAKLAVLEQEKESLVLV